MKDIIRGLIATILFLAGGILIFLRVTEKIFNPIWLYQSAIIVGVMLILGGVAILGALAEELGTSH